MNFSFQLYSARDYQPYSSVLDKLAAAGFSDVEGYQQNIADMDEAGLAQWRADLNRTGLKMRSFHIHDTFLESRVDWVERIARELGVESIYAPWLEPKDRPTDADGWIAFGKRLSTIGKIYRDKGFNFGWHNHDFEFIRLPDGSMPIDRIFEGGPDLSWQADFAWVFRVDEDPFFWIDRLGDRIDAVHVKDVAPKGEALDEYGMADAGTGAMPWAAMMERLRKLPIRHYVVEHDMANDLDRLIRRSSDFLKKY